MSLSHVTVTWHFFVKMFVMQAVCWKICIKHNPLRAEGAQNFDIFIHVTVKYSKNIVQIALYSKLYSNGFSWTGYLWNRKYCVPKARENFHYEIAFRKIMMFGNGSSTRLLAHKKFISLDKNVIYHRAKYTPNFDISCINFSKICLSCDLNVFFKVYLLY